MAIEFDNDLRQRLAAFQKAVGLSGDGVAGQKTWEKLTEQAPAVTAEVREAEGTSEGTSEAVRPEHDSLRLPAADYPALTRVLSLDRTDEAVKGWLRDDVGLDLDRVLAAMDAVLPAGEEVTA
jgi:hypothetical protein